MPNDIFYMWSIIIILFSLGIFVPIAQGAFGEDTNTYDTGEVTDDVGENLASSGTSSVVSGIAVLVSILGMFFWSFNVPFWLNIIILEPMRIMLYILIYRQFRSGGG